MKFSNKTHYPGPRFAMWFVIVVGMCSIALGIRHTFVDQDIVAAIVGISSASALYYLHRNPKILMTTTIDEFSDIYDESIDKKTI